jgi:hypothetical protein
MQTFESSFFARHLDRFFFLRKRLAQETEKAADEVDLDGRVGPSAMPGMSDSPGLCLRQGAA